MNIKSIDHLLDISNEIGNYFIYFLIDYYSRKT